MTSQAGLRAAIREGRFAITAEIGVPSGADAAAIGRKAAILAPYVDAANITDNPSARVHLASIAGSVAVLRAGLEPVMQLTCRDRNRIALQSDLLGAAALAIPNVLLLTGDHTRFGDHPEAKPVFDLDSVQLVGVARTMRDYGRLMSGGTLGNTPGWLIGAVENPFAPPTRFRAARLAKKVVAGAEFVQTQFVFDVEAFRRWMDEVCQLGVSRHCAVLAGVGPIRSRRALEFLRTKVPGVVVPEELYRRLRRVPDDRFSAEGMRACVEIIEEIAVLPGVAGVHVMAFGREDQVPELLERAGLGRPADGRPSSPVTVQAATATSADGGSGDGE